MKKHGIQRYWIRWQQFEANLRFKQLASTTTDSFRYPSPSVLIPALCTVGNIVIGDDLQTQFVIENGALPCLLDLLTNNHKKSTKKEACWTISNITAGNKDQIQFDIKKEAAWAISNATSGGTQEQIKFLVTEGCIKPLCDLLICPDPHIVTVCLEGLENILKIGEAFKNMGLSGDVNQYAQLIDDAEGLEKIEHLQSHDNTEIYEKAVKIPEKTTSSQHLHSSHFGVYFFSVGGGITFAWSL